jgi:ectoine hydroxylase-related dioxygenase (phytanoyl-CoA dioxygenase family)
MLDQANIDRYHRDGYIVLPNWLDAALTKELRDTTQALADKARGLAAPDKVYDLEPWHTPETPALRRITWPHDVHPFFHGLARHPRILGAIKKLIGDAIRLHGSKINFKLGGGGASVEWHQDWAFYPHSNEDVLAVGIMIDDMTTENGPMFVLPGSHRGPLCSHHVDGHFCGAIDPSVVKLDFSGKVPVTGPAGSISIHHARLVHGSDFNRSGAQRRFLLFEYAAADAWPLRGTVTGYEDFRARLVCGEEPEEYRMVAAPVRVPYPTPPTGPSVYLAQQSMRAKSFEREKAPAK